MALKDLITQDISNLFLDTDGEGVAGTYTPVGQATSFPIVVCFSTASMVHIQSGPRIDSHEKCDVLALAATIRTGIAGIETTARDPLRGDKITIPAGQEHTGDWLVLGFYPDGLGGLILQTQRLTAESTGGEGVEEFE